MKILICDDNKISKKVLAKSLKKIGDCSVTTDGASALKLFQKSLKQKKPFDLLTLDISMPFMSGIEVLGAIRKTERKLKIPKADRIKIIMVTAKMNKATINKCISLGCNNYIAKPIHKIQLYKTISKCGFKISENLFQKGYNSHQGIVADVIKRFYKGEIKLPIFPHIIQKVQDYVKTDDASIEGLSDIIEKDPVISAKLIAIANSPLYKGVDTVNTVGSALTRLGLKSTQAVISSIANKNLFDSEDSETRPMFEKLWQHSFACACCAKLIAESIDFDGHETVFQMGIIHDIGKVLLIKAISDTFDEEFFDDEQIQIAIQETHTTFGGALLKKWKFTDDYIRIAELHQWNSFPEGTETELILVSLANYVANKIGFHFFGFNRIDEDQDDLKLRDSALTCLDMDPEQLVEIEANSEMIILESLHAYDY